MASYATLEQLQRYVFQGQASDTATLEEILERASRLFDRVSGHKPNYFAAGDSSVAASARKFWGDGTDYLKIDPYLSSPAITVAMPTAFDVPTYLESRNLPNTDDGQGFFLIRTYGDSESRLGAITQSNWLDGERFAMDLTSPDLGWPDGIKVTVTAKWGWDAVPVDVVEAVLETSTAIWRQKDQAFARVINLETNTTINDVMPARAREIADRYRRGRGLLV